MRECLISKVDWSLKSEKTYIVVYHTSRPTQVELVVNSQLCPQRFRLEYNGLFVIRKIVISWEGKTSIHDLQNISSSISLTQHHCDIIVNILDLPIVSSFSEAVASSEDVSV